MPKLRERDIRNLIKVKRNLIPTIHASVQEKVHDKGTTTKFAADIVFINYPKNTVQKIIQTKDHRIRTRKQTANYASKRSAQKTTAKNTVEQGRRKFIQDAKIKVTTASLYTSSKATKWYKTVENAMVQSLKSVIHTGISATVLISLVAILAAILVIGAISASPLGIFLSNEPNPNTVSLKSAVAQLGAELNNELLSLQAGEYDKIIIDGTPPNWADVIAVFACYTSDANNGTDVAFLTDRKISLLREVFWQMCHITSSVAFIEHPNSNIDNEMNEVHLETILTISISSRTPEEMCSIYGFTDYQDEMLGLLLSNAESLRALIN